MPAFLVSSCLITDAEKYRRYAETAGPLTARFGGALMAIGYVTEYLEGVGDPRARTVVTKFPDAQAARDFYLCPEYQAAKKLRADCAVNVVMRIVE